MNLDEKTANRIIQIRRSHANARPKHDNPAWFHTHNDLDFVLKFMDSLTESYELGHGIPLPAPISLDKIEEIARRFVAYFDSEIDGGEGLFEERMEVFAEQFRQVLL